MKKKVRAAKKYLSQLNPFITIHTYPYYFDTYHAEKIIDDYDIIADCTDNLTSRYIINQQCVKLNKPFVYAGIWKHQGQLMLTHHPQGPCFNCVFPFDSDAKNLANCHETGVLGVLPGILGTMQANLIIQSILGYSHSMTGKLLTWNACTFELKSYDVERDPNCMTCVLQQNLSLKKNTLSLADLDKLTKNHRPFTLLDVRTAEEREFYHLGGLFIPLTELENRLHEIDKQFPVIVYCQSGRRSNLAATILVKNGFTSVSILNHSIKL